MVLSVGTQGEDAPTRLELFTMELFGWTRIEDNEPDESTVRKVENVLSQERIHCVPPFLFRKGGPECKSFLNSGNQIQAIVEKFFQAPFSGIKKQGPAIVKFEGGTSDQELRPMRAHPTPVRSLSIFRSLERRAEWNTGLFKVYSSSDNLTKDEFENNANKDLHEVVLETNELLVVSGGLYIQPSPSSGGRIVWQGFSERPMYEDIYSSWALPFMKI